MTLTTIGVVVPHQPAAVEGFEKLARLLRGGRESVQTLLVDLREGGASKPAAAGRKTGSSRAGDKLKNVVADLFICWGGQALGKVLRQQPERPVVYGVTLDDLRQGAVPSHPRIVGYLCDSGFPQAALIGAGVPFNKRFSLSAWLGTEDAQSSGSTFCGFRHSALLIGDDPGLVAAAKGACELLGFRLERLPPSAVAQGFPAAFYGRYDCVIGSGWAALDAAAAGVAVIVADGRGTAGRLTAENLRRVLDANAGPACFDGPIGAEAILAALPNGTDSDGLGEALRLAHSESVRFHQLLGWLRQLALEAAPLSIPDKAVGAPLRLDISAASLAEPGGVAGLSGREADAPNPPWPVAETLVDAVEEPAVPAALPKLPLNQRIPLGGGSDYPGVFGEGWYDSEPWGRWAGGREAVLRFMVEGDGGGELELLLHLHAFLPPVRVFQRVVVNVNGQWLLCWRVDRQAREAPFRLPLRPELLGEDRVWRVRLFLPDADMPRCWGPGDCRQLGVGLGGLELRRVDRPAKPPAVPRLALDQRVPTGGDQAPAGLFGEGWHRSERWGRWSGSREPTLRFAAPADEGELEALLYLCVFLPPGRSFQRVIASVNGRPLLCWKVDREARKSLDRKRWDAPFRLPLPPEWRSRDGVWRVKFSLPDAETPTAWGQRDVRQLGLGLAGLELRRVTEIAKPPAPPCLPPDRFIAARDDAALAGLFGEGWHRGEAWGRWSESGEAVLRFKSEADQGDQELLLHLLAYLPPGRLFQRVVASVNGRPALCWMIDREARAKARRGGPDAPFRLPLRREWLGGDGLWRVRFHLPDADLPSGWGRNDERRLGLGLVGLELRRPVESAKPLPPPRLPVDRYIPAGDGEILAGFFGEGWSRAESWGRWTEKAEAALRFETEMVDGDFELLFYMRCYLAPNRVFSRVIVTVNGQPRLCWKVGRQPKGTPFCVPLLREWRSNNGLWRIGLLLPDAEIPRTWGAGDCRMLGLGLTGLELRHTRPPKNNVSYTKPAN